MGNVFVKKRMYVELLILNVALKEQYAAMIKGMVHVNHLVMFVVQMGEDVMLKLVNTVAGRNVVPKISNAKEENALGYLLRNL